MFLVQRKIIGISTKVSSSSYLRTNYLDKILVFSPYYRYVYVCFVLCGMVFVFHILDASIYS